MASYHRVCILVGSLAAPGGAERVACWLANSWACRGHSVTLVSLGPSVESFFDLQNGVKVVAVGHEPQEQNLLRSTLLWMRLAVKLRRALRAIAPDCLISFISINNVIALLTSWGLKAKVIVSERSDPNVRRLPYRWEALRRLTYPWANSVVVQTQSALSFFPPKIQSRARVIPNPVLPPVEGIPQPASMRRCRTVMGLGSLRHIKGFDLLIDAFSRVASNHPEWELVIYGEGPCRPDLQEQINRAGLRKRISLPGVTSDPHSRLREADLFVLCSRSEGFPNALAEAMACGLAVLSFDCISGPRELIRDRVDGVLVPDRDLAALTVQLDRLMGDAVERNRLAQRATEVVERFSAAKVLALWEQTIEGTPAVNLATTRPSELIVSSES